WLALAPERRTPWLERGDLRASAALLLLEEAAQRREELLARDELKRLLPGRDGSAETPSSEARAQLRAVLDLEGLLSRPAALLPSGYGLPQRTEREALAIEAQRQTTRLHEHDRHLHDQARALLSPQRQARLSSIDDNLALLARRLRQLHRDSGGLELE